MDQTYTFYAGLPYFFKVGTMEMVQPTDIEAMRDDEWVVSGYSFTDTLWLDRHGRLHEGEVPPAEVNELWGVGFYHRDSRDAFVALRLVHEGEQAVPAHGGVPTLHYAGHGQLWSRYPAEKATFQAGAVLRQKSAYVVQPYPVEGGPRELEQLRHQLLHPLQVSGCDVPRPRGARAEGSLGRCEEGDGSAELKSAVWKALREVRDEQLYQIRSSIVDLGYVYDVCVRAGVIVVLVTMPHRGRPVHEFLVTAGGGRAEKGIRERVSAIPGVRSVVVEMTWNPPWTAARLSDTARHELGLGS
jgi:metal-sulfur cluster biosynthetic enzyme